MEPVEIPIDRELYDNIGAFWRPARPIAAEQSKQFAYALRWGPARTGDGLAYVTATRSGLTLYEQRQLFVVDFARPAAGAYGPVCHAAKARHGMPSAAPIP